MRVVVARRAELDLAELCAWIAQDKPRAAERMLDRLVAAAHSLSVHPLRYPTIGFHSLRKRPVGDFLIFYSVDDVINVVRIFHAARDWPALLDEI